MANTIRAKYSAGPKARDQRASAGANSMMPPMASMEPTKELTAEMERATPALPCWAMG